jgi:putative ABC transport system ATP-binding protein
MLKTGSEALDRGSLAGPLVQALNISRSLPLAGQPIHILKDISFDIEAGEMVALVGASGSGKSTLLGILAGIDAPSSGRLVIDGEDVTGLNETKLALLRNRKLGIVFQSFNLIPTLTAQENVEIPLYVSPYAREARQRAARMLDLVGLSDRRQHRPHQLSGGQQQRVAIARALVTEPKILLADEPTGNLDSHTGEQVLDLFESLRQQLGLTLVVATHDNAIAGRANRILRIADGRLLHTSSNVER